MYLLKLIFIYLFNANVTFPPWFQLISRKAETDICGYHGFDNKLYRSGSFLKHDNTKFYDDLANLLAFMLKVKKLNFSHPINHLCEKID